MGFPAVCADILSDILEIRFASTGSIFTADNSPYLLTLSNRTDTDGTTRDISFHMTAKRGIARRKIFPVIMRSSFQARPIERRSQAIIVILPTPK